MNFLVFKNFICLFIYLFFFFICEFLFFVCYISSLNCCVVWGWFFERQSQKDELMFSCRARQRYRAACQREYYPCHDDINLTNSNSQSSYILPVLYMHRNTLSCNDDNVNVITPLSTIYIIH